jgi:hypothetical protein
MPSLVDIPPESFIFINSYLQPTYLTKLALVSKRYRDTAEDALWKDIELHRQDPHHDKSALSLSTYRRTNRAYLDSKLDETGPYRTESGHDFDFERRNGHFGTVIRNNYQSQHWERLSCFTRRICLTVTHKSPKVIWNAILSFPTLISVEIIGEANVDLNGQFLGPPKTNKLGYPLAQNVRDIRLRGYIPSEFVVALCQARLPYLRSLDLGILEYPKKDQSRKSDELEGLFKGTNFTAPRSVLWFSPTTMSLGSLTHLHLCKLGTIESPLEHPSRKRYFLIEEDVPHDITELRQWATLLKTVRHNIVELMLEQRRVLGRRKYCAFGMPSGENVHFLSGDEAEKRETIFFRFMKDMFGNGCQWPKLKRLTFCGFNLDGPGFREEFGEDFEAFASRALPGVLAKHEYGRFMTYSTKNGAIVNRPGVDGLRPQFTRTRRSLRAHSEG